MERRSPGDLDAQVAELFAPLTCNMSVWNDISRRYRGRLFCGLFLNEFNEGLTLSSDTLTAIGSRGLNLDMDIYAPGEAGDSDRGMEPPWQMYPDIPPGSIGWRMGRGEEYLLTFQPWFASLAPDEQAKFKGQHPEPHGWRGFYPG